MQRRRTTFPTLPCLILLIVLCAGIAAISLLAAAIPRQAERVFGPPAASLSPVQRMRYSLQLLLHEEALTTSSRRAEAPGEFEIQMGESPGSIAVRLSAGGFITDPESFQDYLVYSGLDTRIQAGNYRLDPGLSPVEIAQSLQDATPKEVSFGVLQGWRMEEIAAGLPTSGLQVSREDFLGVVRNLEIVPGLKSELPSAASLEGFLFPGSYTFRRDISAAEMVLVMVSRFQEQITPEMQAGFSEQGLSLFEAVTLASIIQREAIVVEEQPQIASVFINRLAAGMKLDSDPTVQYALGHNENQGTWWTNPLTVQDLQEISPYNTYIYPGLPPGPISNPGLSALQAVASPAETPYFYFRARCDGSRMHLFAATYEEHLLNQCP